MNKYNPLRWPGMAVEKIHNSRAAKAVDRAFYGPVKRFVGSVGLGVGAGIAGSAGAAGALFGNGETLSEKLMDAGTAVPKGIVNTFTHWMNAPEYAENASNVLRYAREQGPEAVEELGSAGGLFQAGVNQWERGVRDLIDSQDYLLPGGNLPFDVQNAYYSARDGKNTLETSMGTLETAKDRAENVLQPAIDALQNVDVNPVVEALYNFADNMAPDEISQTVGIAAGSLAAAYLANQYIRGFWGRRGNPGWIKEWIQRRGIKRFRDYFVDNPEKIAGPEAVEVVKDYLAKNPDALAEVTSRAGYGLTKLNLKSE